MPEFYISKKFQQSSCVQFSLLIFISNHEERYKEFYGPGME